MIESKVKELGEITIEGTAWLTVDGKILEPGNTLRRPGAHIDGNYIPQICGWGNGGGNGWKVGEGGRKITSEHHKLSYNNPQGGMIICSDFSACKGWEGNYVGEPNVGGDCSHISLKEGFMLKPNTVYYGKVNLFMNLYQYKKKYIEP